MMRLHKRMADQILCIAPNRRAVRSCRAACALSRFTASVFLGALLFSEANPPLRAQTDTNSALSSLAPEGVSTTNELESLEALDSDPADDDNVRPSFESAQLALEEPPESMATNHLVLGVRQCIALGLVNNLELQVEAINPRIAAEQIRQERGAFEPTFNGAAEWVDRTNPRDAESVAATGITRTESETVRYSAGFAGLLPTGTRWELSANTVNNENTFNEFRSQYDAGADVVLIQPLLRGFGTDVNLAPLRIARVGLAAANANFEHTVALVVRDIYFAYFDLIFARSDLEARRRFLDVSQQLLADNEARVRLGTLAPLEISTARAEVALRLEELIRAQQVLREAENRLKRLIFSDILPFLRWEIFPTELPPPPTQPRGLDSIATALARRNDLIERRLRVDQSDLRLRVAKNDLLPAVDVRGSYGLIGQEDSFGESFQNTFDAYNREWTIGVTVSVPLGMSAERGRKNQAALERQQAALSVQQLEQDIIVEVDNALRAVETNRRRHIAAREALALAIETAEAEQQKLDAGTSTTFVVSRLQRDAFFAKTRELEALADWRRSIVELARVQGILLQATDLLLRDAPPAPNTKQ